MPYASTAFRRLLEPLDRHTLSQTAARHNANHGVGTGGKAWSCQRHLKALIFAQVAGLDSLREIEQGLCARPDALYHLDLRVPKRTTLSDASAKRPAAFFHDIAQHLMASTARKLRGEGRALTELIDASPIPLRDLRFTWPQADNRVRGLKLYVHHDPDANMPVAFHLSSPKISDSALARDASVEAGRVYVFDKGFAEYGFWQRIVDAGSVFVTRLKRDAKRREVLPLPLIPDETGILGECLLKVGHKSPRAGAINPLHDTQLREITVAREGKTPLVLITNDMTRSADEIAALYKQRWQIELFFKWIKQNLNVRTFLGRSENAVRIQLYAAIIAFLLIRLAKQGFAATHEGSLKDFKARIAVALLSPLNLTNRNKPPPFKTTTRNQPLQFVLPGIQTL